MKMVEMVMPQMGESVMEGTILKWYKKVGETINEDDSIIEVATDKVDTDIPSAYTGTIVEIYVQEGEVAQIGKPICKIDLSGSQTVVIPVVETPISVSPSVPSQEETEVISNSGDLTLNDILLPKAIPGRFYSPLVLNIARAEKIEMTTLEKIKGTGKEERVTKKDILLYVELKKQPQAKKVAAEIPQVKPVIIETVPVSKPESSPVITSAPPKIEVKDEPKKPEPIPFTGECEIIEMDRMRKIIAERMLESRRTSAHVTSWVEADVTNMVYWKNRKKTHFMEKENVALTLTPICVEAVAKAIKDYPKINSSVYGDKIYQKKDINIGIAVALPNGNLIVPVIKNADQLNLVGLTKKVNDLAKRARNNQLKPEDLEGGTFTVSNMGSFGNIMGTPIIVQPQVGILALGAVVKKPTVIETPYGDTIGIRHKMILSHSYDHRIVDGALGGMFVRRVADYMERFDLNREV